MEVTSIRLEKELKEKLKALSGNQGYQSLIRDILWNYVWQKSGDYQAQISSDDIRASVPAIAQQEQRCMLTGTIIKPQDSMFLGLTPQGDMVPLSCESLD
ncbi:hypothetical protein [Okeania sp. SIO2G5]|uniref:hypothetical protein n=1 Tax=Okeania sp. SIO2G5 TaxID=2607796 RepID=UPI0025807E1D|nr:hypothetical protein [Okeania sp. SIO2G5]